MLLDKALHVYHMQSCPSLRARTRLNIESSDFVLLHTFHHSDGQLVSAVVPIIFKDSKSSNSWAAPLTRQRKAVISNNMASTSSCIFFLIQNRLHMKFWLIFALLFSPPSPQKVLKSPTLARIQFGIIVEPKCQGITSKLKLLMLIQEKKSRKTHQSKNPYLK